MSSGVGRTRTTSYPSDAVNPSSASRRVTTTSHGRSPTPRHSCSSRSAEASSIRCALSNTSTAGSVSNRCSSSIVACSRRALRNSSARASTSLVDGRSASTTRATRGSHGSTAGWSRSAAVRSSSAAASGPSPAGTRRTSRSSVRNGQYAVAVSYSSHRLTNVSRSVVRSSSWTSRVLPIPGGPDSSTTDPRPERARSRAASRVASSSARPTSAVSGAWTPCADSSRIPTLAASTGADFPLTWKGGKGSTSNWRAERARASAVASSWPGCALPSTRAARLMASPLTEYVRRNGGPKSPAKTGPQLRPIRSGSVPKRSTICRAARSSRSSWWSELRGAPAVSMILPPSRLMSDSKNVTPCRSAACWTLRTHSSSAPASAAGPSWASSASVPENCTNATAICRCSGSPADVCRCARIGGGIREARSIPADGTRGTGARSASRGSPTSSRRSPSDPPTRAGASRAAVCGVSPISPAAVRASTSAVALAAGPLTTSSRWIAGSPTRKKWKVPLWIPTDIRSVTSPLGVLTRPIRRSRARIRCAARAARTACSSPWNSSRTASPPHFTRLAASRYATWSRSAKVAFRMSLMRSAPTLPSRASRSVSWVNPEMSTNASEPCTSRHKAEGCSRSQVVARFGTYGSSTALPSMDLPSRRSWGQSGPERWRHGRRTGEPGLRGAPRCYGLGVPRTANPRRSRARARRGPRRWERVPRCS